MRLSVSARRKLPRARSSKNGRSSSRMVTFAPQCCAARSLPVKRSLPDRRIPTAGSVCLQHALAKGIAHQLVAVPQAELLHDPLAVGVHRLGADDQLLGNLGAAVTLGDQFQDFPLPLGEPIEGFVLAG